MFRIPRYKYGESNSKINKGKYAGCDRYYKDALYSTLLYLQPKVCLEIGTYYGGSTDVFIRYFEECRKDGILVTCDIHKYRDINSQYVKQILVYPHCPINGFHDVKSENMLNGALNFIGDSVEDSIKRIKSISEEFDFAFIDGDHQRTSVYNDFKIAESVLKHPKYILFDDTEEFEHDSAIIYHEEIKKRTDINIEDFSDWDCIVGMSLLWNKK